MNKININNKKVRGFTLIELLVTIAIIGVLAGLSIFGIQGAMENARDAQRKSDLKQYQSAIETYANKNQEMYPSYLEGVNAATTLCATLSLSTCPTDPKTDRTYVYQTPDGSSGGTADATEYFMTALLEGTDSLYWVVCSSGKSGAVAGGKDFTTCPL